MKRLLTKRPRNARPALALAAAALAAAAVSACTPTLGLQGGDKPITINLNVKIDQEVRVRLDKEINDLIAKNPDAF